MSLLTKSLGMDVGPSAEEGRYRALADRSRAGASSYLRQFQPLLDRASTDAARFRPQTNSALEDYRTLLSRRRTDADRSNFVSQRVAPINRQYQMGQAALSSNLRARGLSPDSSAGIGGLSALESMRGNAYAGAQMDATQQFDDERQSNLAEIYNLLYGRQMESEGQEAGLLSQIQALLGQEADTYQGLYNQERSIREQQAAERRGLIGQIASYASGYFGGGIGGGRAAGGYSTPGDAQRSRNLALSNNRRVSATAPAARNARWGIGPTSLPWDTGIVPIVDGWG